MSDKAFAFAVFWAGVAVVFWGIGLVIVTIQAIKRRKG